LLDRLDAPERAGPRCADRLAVHQHIDGIRVQLREMSEGNPRASLDWKVEFQIVYLAVGGLVLAAAYRSVRTRGLLSRPGY